MTFLNCFPLLVPLIVYLKIDPFYYVFVLICPDNVLINILIVLLRALLSFLCVVFAVRHFNMILVAGLESLRTVKCRLNSLVPKSFDYHLSNKTPAWQWVQCMKSVFEYRVFFTFFVFYAQEVLSNVAFASMTTALVAGVIVNFGSLRMYHLAPFPVYFASVSLSLVIPVLCFGLLPFVTSVIESSDKVLRQWMVQARVFPLIRRRLFRREIRSLVPCSVKMMLGNYNFMVVRNSVTMSFFRRYCEYTINACLSIPL
jgi:hypothetical protein